MGVGAGLLRNGLQPKSAHRRQDARPKRKMRSTCIAWWRLERRLPCRFSCRQSRLVLCTRLAKKLLGLSTLANASMRRVGRPRSLLAWAGSSAPRLTESGVPELSANDQDADGLANLPMDHGVRDMLQRMHPSKVVGRCADGRKRHPQIGHARERVEEVVRERRTALPAVEGGRASRRSCSAPRWRL